ncbi:MAG: hypothetical protein ACFBWO_01045 [Paracoccaceae bacterium]
MRSIIATAALAIAATALPAEAGSPVRGQMERLDREWAAARAGAPGYEMPGFMRAFVGAEPEAAAAERETRDAAKERASVPPPAPAAPAR